MPVHRQALKRCTQLNQPSSILELLGQIRERQILYCHVRSEEHWFTALDIDNWIAFTIADEEDKELLSEIANHCLNNGACYICSAGMLASLTEDYYDDEIVWREVQKEEETGIVQDYDNTPMTSFHKNFDEGFWFAATVAKQVINDNYILSNHVVCVDCTTGRVRRHLLNLVEMINNGWLPPEEEVKRPNYDN